MEYLDINQAIQAGESLPTKPMEAVERRFVPEGDVHKTPNPTFMRECRSG